ncbi:hypothetical protein [Micromonospora inyonensis]|uniref:Uncharacterized protein n=1 Tax=Micromonospora inyonensis TaxID=47866 RepID=A0A1C6SAB9_9ACTN|nr:hypothetical protein [Micromonospora inyonensis]SCL26420.1 hypothetical protein GA0074694_4513 [Micromonospora inyonensis]
MERTTVVLEVATGAVGLALGVVRLVAETVDWWCARRRGAAVEEATSRCGAVGDAGRGGSGGERTGTWEDDGA